MTTATLPRTSARPAGGTGPPPDTVVSQPPLWQLALLWTFLVGPLVAIAGGIALAATAGLGPTWLDAGLALGTYAVVGHGVSVGLHRYFTHAAFTAKRPLRIGLAVLGCFSVEGTVTSWVAAHRRHHAFADTAGDPHSPWRFGTGPVALAKGLWWAQVGWLFSREQTNVERYAPDLLADRDLQRVDRLYPVWALLSVFGPGVVGGLVTESWSGALTAFVWAGVVRMFLLHHVTWSVNSICHVAGERPFRARGKATNYWPLAIIAFGESWHNLHHADPVCARHGVDPGQVDSTAVVIRGFERLGWATRVRWPSADRTERLRRPGAAEPAGG